MKEVIMRKFIFVIPALLLIGCATTPEGQFVGTATTATSASSRPALFKDKPGQAIPTRSGTLRLPQQ
jgi:hypothetical protein